MDKKYFLVKQLQYYVDPHGEPELGNTTKFVTDNTLYERINEKLYYSRAFLDDFECIDENITPEEINEIFENRGCPENEMRGSEDGYNRTYYQFSIQIITEAQFQEYEKIINAYHEI